MTPRMKPFLKKRNSWKFIHARTVFLTLLTEGKWVSFKDVTRLGNKKKSDGDKSELYGRWLIKSQCKHTKLSLMRGVNKSFVLGVKYLSDEAFLGFLLKLD